MATFAVVVAGVLPLRLLALGRFVRSDRLVKGQVSGVSKVSGEGRLVLRPGIARAVREESQVPLVSVVRVQTEEVVRICLLYTSPSPRDRTRSRMPSSA